MNFSVAKTRCFRDLQLFVNFLSTFFQNPAFHANFFPTFPNFGASGGGFVKKPTHRMIA
jgi:hypothetical protein